jgi:hypothetical protein
MGYEKGIIKSQETLKILLSDEQLETKVGNAFSAIMQMNLEDTSAENFKEVVEWCERYTQKVGLNISLDGMLKKIDMEKDLFKLSDNLKSLCTRIIDYNANHGGNL